MSAAVACAYAEAIGTALGWKVLPIQGDGNCLFRALPWEWDDALQDRNATVTFCCYQPWQVVENHVWKMQHLTVWRIQVELQAAGPLKFSKQRHKYSWQCYQPWDSSKVNFPETEPSPTHLSNLDHVELLHLRGCQFDCILHREGGFSLDSPVLESGRDWFGFCIPDVTWLLLLPYSKCCEHSAPHTRNYLSCKCNFWRC